MVYAVCVSLCCVVIYSQWAMLPPVARAVAVYAPGLTSAAYTQTASAITIWYFSSGMMHMRYKYYVGILPDRYQWTNPLPQIPTKQSVPTSREVLPGYFGLPIRIPTLRSLIGPAIGKA